MRTWLPSRPCDCLATCSETSASTWKVGHQWYIPPKTINLKISVHFLYRTPIKSAKNICRKGLCIIRFTDCAGATSRRRQQGISLRAQRWPPRFGESGASPPGSACRPPPRIRCGAVLPLLEMTRAQLLTVRCTKTTDLYEHSPPLGKQACVHTAEKQSILLRSNVSIPFSSQGSRTFRQGNVCRERSIVYPKQPPGFGSRARGHAHADPRRHPRC